ncbi:hypothetical protein EV210_109194 [Anaerospora hongkongensis]|uniref:Uncharacterized protein n=1 Tax=Anaerospora hongkongensis TaxID=244830 RepID=A0A4R1PY84_9FIRM|nr:hypothetical protein [Anaerospora hongkongensis]TCL36244.1 hypothetical protein EV210_109194 [Anaerospora hongkongensis]
MYIIKTMADVRRLKLAGSISPELAAHFARKMNRLRENFAPELDLEEFNLETHGVFGILEPADQDLTAIGLPESLALIMPEWVSRLAVAGEVFYVLYLMADNDFIDQVYLPDAIMPDKIRLWLSEQPAEEESEEDIDDNAIHPF